MKRINVKLLADQVDLEYQIIKLIEDAVYVERFFAKPHNRNCPSMYSLIDMAYTKDDYGYWTHKLKLRATPKQVSRWEFVIEMLLMIEKDISDDPVLDRKILWLRANRIKWTTLGKMFGKHRTTVKKMYEIILNRLATKINATMLDKYDKFFI